MINKIFISGKLYEIYVMKSYLLKNNVNREDIIIDQNGINTYHTIKNIKLYISSNKNISTIFISQRYHLPRIKLLIARIGIKNNLLISTDHKKIDKDEEISIILRESFAIIKSFILDLY